MCELRCPFSCVLCVSLPLGQRAGGIDAAPSPPPPPNTPRVRGIDAECFPLGASVGGIDAAFFSLLSFWPGAGGIDAAFFSPCFSLGKGRVELMQLFSLLALVLAKGGWN